MSTKKRLLTATSGMAVVTLASRISGLARDKVVAFLLGAGSVADAFYTGFRIPNMFRQLLAEGALQAAFIPTLAELKAKEDQARTRAFVRAMTSLLLLALPVVVALGILAAPWLVHLFAASFAADPAKFALTVRLTRLMFPYLGLISLAALAQGVLNASDRFLLPAATPIGLNLCIVAGTVTAVSLGGVRPEWMAIGVLAGGFAQLAMQWAVCGRVGLPMIPGAGALSNPEVRRVLVKMAPTVTTLGIYPLTLMLANRFAASVGNGAVTCVYNASRANELVYGVVIVQLTTAVLPMLAAERQTSEPAARSTLAFALRLLSAVAIPSTVFSAVLATPIIGALFGGGRYTLTDVRTAAAALLVYSVGMPFLGLTKLLASASFAWNDTRSPVAASAANLGVFFVLGLILTGPFGVRGVAGASVGGQVVNALVLLWLDGRRRRLPHSRDVLPAVGRHVVAAAALGAVVSLLDRAFPIPLHTSVRSLAMLGAWALTGVAVYALVLALIGADEWREAKQFIRRRLTP
ncbi:MAG TPA: murein biosynthesis integral membrane protein MurJ [Thermoanaerobaculaceae bacterium]|nr:murein biosynthesis integral membrane protein MurJ [Thermoanaerobaculaceae bacterium]